jgi:hypothetical protein
MRIPEISFEINCRYDPISRIKSNPNFSPKYFEYDMIGFPKDKHSNQVDERHPSFFVEFTNSRYFSTQKFVYETWRWIWFLYLMGFLRALPPFEQEYKDRRVENDISGRIWKPKLIQIWKANTVRAHYSDAILDWLLHHSTVFNIRGHSYRLRGKLQAGTASIATTAGHAMPAEKRYEQARAS